MGAKNKPKPIALAKPLGASATAKEPPDGAPGHPIELEALTAFSCRWPIGDGPYLFCGKARLSGHTYCRACERLAFQVARPGEKR
jgi:hypothetical protein